MCSYSEEQKKFFSTGKTLDISFRLEQLKKLRKLIVDNEDNILRAVRADLARPETEVYTGEILSVLMEIDLFIKKLKSWSRPRRVKTPLLLMPATSRIIYEPLGSVLIIAPWNYPFQLLITPLAGAIAAGNCVTLKPSEISGNTAKIVTDIINNNFSKEYITSVEGGPEVSSGLIKEKFNHILFTGGGGIARKVLKAAAENLVPVTLELGGKCPCIVASDADLSLAARRIAWGKFFNAGQTCLAPDYILADKKISEQLYEALEKSIKDFYTEDPFSSPDYGRIINERHFERIIKLAGDLIPENFKADKEERYIPPAIIRDVKSTDNIMNEEIFGPILPVIEYTELEEAIDIINSQTKPLGSYLFTFSKKTIREVSEKTSAGSLTVNDTLFQIASYNLPFGGVGESGMGRYRGFSSFELYSNKKSYMRRSRFFDLSFRYPPYRVPVSKLKKLLRWL